MPVNHVLLETIQLSQSAATVTFDNIPQTGYNGLKIVVSAKTDRSTALVDNVKLSINGSGFNTSITNRSIVGTGSAISSYSNVPQFAGGFATSNTTTANTFGNTEIYFSNYNSTNSYKTISTDSVTEHNATEAYSILGSSLYSSNSAITSIAFTPDVGTNWLANSTFSLYGIAATGTSPVVGPKAQGGNIVANDGTYWYHAFLSSGTFTPRISLTCDILTIAGGGGGQGGGGGAGGLVYSASQSLTAIGYNCTIGAGGANLTNGVNSQFGALTAAVGGGGASSWGDVGKNGGSGGGGASTSGTTINGGTGTAGQGNNGGSGVSNGGGGGGGAGAAGSNGNTNGGAGGVGLATYSSWGLATSTGQNSSGTYYYAGGGGGGNNSGSTPAGGLGGGGNGSNASPTAGTANTGGGGGGAYGAAGQPGGSGIVIVRYAMA